MKHLLIKILAPMLAGLLYMPSALSDDSSEPYNYAMQLGYKDQGKGTLREYQRGDVNEVIDPFTGALKRVYTDAYIKLNYGLSFPILRTYTNLQNSASGVPEAYRSPKASPIGGRGVMGAGWDIHFGRIWTFGNQTISTSNCHAANLAGKWNPVLELPDGTRKVFYNAVAADELITSDFWRAKCLPYGGGSSPYGGLTVYAPDGLVYDFIQPGNVTPGDSPDNSLPQRYQYAVSAIWNKPRTSNIVFDYKFVGSYLVLDKIRSGASPLVTFNYSSNAKSWSARLDSISISGGGTINYSYLDFGGDFPSAQPLHLMTVSLPDIGNWNYSYFDSAVSNSGEGQYSLATATSPAGATTTYEYGAYNFSSASPQPQELESVVVKKKTVSGSAESSNWSYNYLTAADGSNSDLTEVLHQGYSCTLYTHKGDKSIPVGNGYNNELSRLGVLLNKKIYASGTVCSGSVLREEIYTWNEISVPTATGGSPSEQQAFRPNPYTVTDHGIKHLALGKLEIQTDGGASKYFMENLNFNSLGLPEQVIEYQAGAGSVGNDWNKRNRTIIYDIATTSTLSNYWRSFQAKNEYTCTGSSYCAANSADKIGWAERTFYSSGLPHTLDDNGVTSYFAWHQGGDLFMKEVFTGADSQVSAFGNYAQSVPKNMSAMAGSTIINRSVDAEGNLLSFNYFPINAREIVRLVDGRGNITSETVSQAGQSTVTGYAYDNANRLTYITTPKVGDHDISIAYSMGSGYTVTQTRGAKVEVQHYNGQGGLTHQHTLDTSNGQTICTSYTRDELNRVIFASYPYPGTESSCSTITGGIATSYDDLGRVESEGSTVNDDGSAMAKIQYDYLSGNKTRVTDENGNVTTYTWYSYGSPEDRHLARIHAPETQTTLIHRNELGRVNSIVQGSVTHTFNYFSDRPFQLESETRPEISVSYGRDNMGNMTSKTVSGITTNYSYDYLNQLTDINYPGSTEDVHLTYTHVGNPQLVQTRQGATLNSQWAYQYDANNNLSVETLTLNGVPYSFSYGRNAYDDVNTVTYPNNHVVTHTLDNLGRTTALSIDDGAVSNLATGIAYFPNGQLQSLTLGNGRSASFTQTARQLPKQFNVNGSTLNLLYSYDNVGNLSGVIDSIHTGTRSNLQYDGLNRLTSVKLPGNVMHGFQYNDRNDITQKSVGANTWNYGYNATSKTLSSISGAETTSFTYDNYGNTTTAWNNTYTFDDSNNLLTATTAKGNESYQYDGHKRRYRISNNLGSYLTLYNSAGKLMSEIDNNGAGNERNYVYLNDQLFYRHDNCVTASNVALGICSWLDEDSDTLDWGSEENNQTNPHALDTDNDGFPDPVELQKGMDPTDSSSATLPLNEIYKGGVMHSTQEAQ